MRETVSVFPPSLLNGFVIQLLAPANTLSREKIVENKWFNAVDRKSVMVPEVP